VIIQHTRRGHGNTTERESGKKAASQNIMSRQWTKTPRKKAMISIRLR